MLEPSALISKNIRKDANNASLLFRFLRKCQFKLVENEQFKFNAKSSEAWAISCLLCLSQLSSYTNIWSPHNLYFHD